MPIEVKCPYLLQGGDFQAYFEKSNCPIQFYIIEGSNEALLQKCQEQAHHIERLKEENELLKNECKKMTWNDLKCNDKKVKYLTGFPNFQTMEIIYQEVEDQLPFTKSGKLSKFDVFIMTLKKIRLDLLFSYISYEYGVTVKSLSLLFHKAVKIISDKLSCFIYWPDKTASIINCPTIFKELFGTKRVFIIDCFEVFWERPGNLLSRANTFSHYKHHKTLKYLIAITAYGAIAFISKAYGVRCSDKFVVENSGFLDHICNGDVILADRGFLIQAAVAAKSAKLIMPTFKNARAQLEPLEVENNRQIASLRIHVERVIGALRQIDNQLLLYQRKRATKCMLIVL